MTEPTSGPMTTEGVNRIEHVDSPTVFGPCLHPEAPKLLLGQGEIRPSTTKMVEVDPVAHPGLMAEVTYYAPDAPVTLVTTVLCAECGKQQVYEVPALHDDTPAPQPPPPPLDVAASVDGKPYYQGDS